MKKKKKRSRCLIVAALAALLAILLCTFLPSRTLTQRTAVCRVHAQGCYAVPLASADTLYLSLSDTLSSSVGLTPEAVFSRVSISGVFVSRAGHVLTTDSLFLRRPSRIASDSLRRRMTRVGQVLSRELKDKRAELTELDYYAARHSVTDDGYNEVMAYRDSIARRVLRLDSVAAAVSRALSVPRLPEAVLCSRLSVTPAGTDTLLPARLVLADARLVVLQCADGQLPCGASRFSPCRFGTYAAGSHLVTCNGLGQEDASVCPVRLSPSDTLFASAEGGAWVNPSGRLSGMLRAGRRVPSASIARVLRRIHPWPVWWWVNLTHWRLPASREAVVARLAAPAALRCVRLSLPDSSTYEGYVLPRTSVRQGYGRLTRADGTQFSGHWQADTLASGTRVEPDGSVYTGAFSAQLLPHGRGVSRSADGTCYSGQWRGGERSGHGFASAPGRLVQCGEWRSGRFLGERMIYTADRIYGIDISRYQHEHGRRRYGIDWNSLRITSLGAGRRVQGAADYPVSYIYIKSTEGRSVVNRYYAADLRAARRHGIPAGTYHFFSLTTSGAGQAAHFLKHSAVAAGDLPPVLDVEPTDVQVRRMGGDAVLFREVRAWLRAVERGCGKRPVLYVSQLFIDRHLSAAPDLLRDYQVWIARYGEYKPYVRLLHWQLTPYGRVRGIRGEVDINVFNGTREQFADYLQTVTR